MTIRHIPTPAYRTAFQRAGHPFPQLAGAAADDIERMISDAERGEFILRAGEQWTPGMIERHVLSALPVMHHRLRRLISIAYKPALSHTIEQPHETPDCETTATRPHQAQSLPYPVSLCSEEPAQAANMQSAAPRSEHPAAHLSKADNRMNPRS